MHARTLIAMLVTMLLAVGAQAHDFGAMLVTLTRMENGRFSGVVRIDPQHLPLARGAALMSSDATVREAAAQKLVAELAGRCFVQFGNEPALAPDLTRDPAAESLPSMSGLVVLAFTFAGPERAGSLRWWCDADFGRYLLRYCDIGDADGESQWLDRGLKSDAYEIGAAAPTPSIGQTCLAYLKLGVTHIIPGGLDHILFVLGLFLVSARLKPVLMQATAFTLAHSATLALAITGVIHPSPRIVEPLIAASIAVVGLENIFVGRFTQRRTAMAFAFGLVHGLGFAGVLSELGIPDGQLLPALAAFNIGVEFAQMAVILTAFACFGLWFRDRSWYRTRLVIPASACIAAVALVWTVQRMGI